MSTSWVQQRSGDALPQNAIKGGQEANQSDIFQIARAVLSDGQVLSLVSPSSHILQHPVRSFESVD